MTSYQVRLYTATGDGLFSLECESIQLSRRVNDIGRGVLVLDALKYNYQQFSRWQIVTIERDLGLGMIPESETIWFVRRKVYSNDFGQPRRLLIYLSDANVILNRIVAYAANSTYAAKSDYADDMLREIFLENFGASATDVTRDISTYVSAMAEQSDGPTLARSFARRNILKLFQDIAQASEQAGTYLAFDVVVTQPPMPSASSRFKLEFRTYTTQRGNDKRWPDGMQPLLIGSDFGNLTNVSIEDDWENEVSYVYAGGSGERDVRIIATASNSDLINISPFGRIETFYDDNDETNPVALADSADEQLQNLRTRTRLKGDFIAGDIRWGYELKFGDYVTIQEQGIKQDCRVDAYAVYFDNKSSGEVVTIVMEGEDAQ